MKYTIMGFLQSKLKEMGLDTMDALILRYFVDFKDSNAMKVRVIGDKYYYWVHYEKVLKALPILNMKKCTIQARFFKMRDAGVLTHQVIKEGGTFSFFGIGERYLELICDEGVKGKEKKGEDVEVITPVDRGSNPSHIDSEKHLLASNPHSIDSKKHPIASNPHPEALNQPPMELNPPLVDLNQSPMELNPQGCQFKLIPNNSSIKDSSYINSITSSNTEETEGCIISHIVDYLNEATGKNYKKNTKATVRLIKARLNEGFTQAEFITVIDNMMDHWKGTRFQQYLAPPTLFGSKFDTYLNYGSKENEEEAHKGYCKEENKKAPFPDRLSGTSYQGGDNKVNHLNSGIGTPSKGSRRKIELILREDM